MSDPEEKFPIFKRVFAKTLIPGRGQPISNACLIFHLNKIVFAGTRKDATVFISNLPQNTTIVDEVSEEMDTVMPGMWDCHVHFVGSRQRLSFLETDFLVKDPIAVGRCAKQLRLCLHSGFTSVREVGGLGEYLSPLVQDGSFAGPNLYHSGKTISMTAGHSDNRDLPFSLCCRNKFGQLVDGDSECLKAVRLNIRNGASCIKIHASGGVMSTGDRLDDRQLSDHEMKTIVEEARRNSMIVAAHCHGRKAIEASLRNGVKTIEHGTFLDEALCEEMINAKAVLVPTCWIVHHILGDNNKKSSTMSKDSWRKGQECKRRHFKALSTAIQMGVTIASGSDMFLDEWDKIGEELGLLVKHGMTNLQAIEAATANGPLTLGKLGPKSGQLKPGFDADFIQVKGNPVENIHVLAKPKNIVRVWKGGSLCKDITSQKESKL